MFEFLYYHDEFNMHQVVEFNVSSIKNQYRISQMQALLAQPHKLLWQIAISMSNRSMI